MKRWSLLLRMVFRAAWVRKDRALTILISAAVVAAIASAALTVYLDLDEKLSHEFRGFGANVIVNNPRAPLSQDQLNMIRQSISRHNASLAGNLRVVPVAYAIATTADGSRVVVGGTDVPAFRELNSWWSVHAENGSGTYVLLGSRAARILSPTGGAFPIAFRSRQIRLSPEIVFNSGSEDDSRIYIDLKEFTALTEAQVNTALLRIEGRPQEIQDAITALRASFPELEVKPVRQITEAETAVVGRTRSLVLAASIVIVGLVLLCMMATLTSSVLERRKDFAVMKALGASNAAVSFLFAAESAFLALAGAIAGFAVGSGLAYWIGKVNFDAAILPQPALLLPVLLGSVTIALLAATLPLQRLRGIQPAGILRGE